MTRLMDNGDIIKEKTIEDDENMFLHSSLRFIVQYGLYNEFESSLMFMPFMCICVNTRNTETSKLESSYIIIIYLVFIHLFYFLFI